MNAYKVEYTKTTRTGNHTHHTVATSRENAVYAAFDELSDQGTDVKKFKRVWMLDSATDLWHVIPAHTPVSPAAL